jgi:hypothetical protein
MAVRSVCVFLILASAVVCAHAQWLDHPTPGTPRTPDGKPNLTAPAPRVSATTPDLSGIWQVEGGPIADLARLMPNGGENGLGEDMPSKYFIDILADFHDRDVPLRAGFHEAYLKSKADFGKDGPITRCLPSGVPLAGLLPTPHKLIQTPGVILMLYEEGTAFRQIFTDGRAHPEDPQPAWYGYSVGRWEGDTLVVETMGFNDQSWLDVMGHTHSTELRLMERYHRRDFGHMDAELTFTDPKTFTRPVTIHFTLELRPDTDLIEHFCAENEKDAEHLVGK